MKSSSDIRKRFPEFFEQRGHTVVASSSLVPADDPTLLFTNAGMVQFKDVFLGNEKRDYVRAASAQRCMRAGGKHNDLENVGYTSRHHTFFEMLGNFSFGDYFKQEAIACAWEFVTRTAGLPREKLYVSVFEEDDETRKIWLEDIGVQPERVRRASAEDNFWSMGDVGPCGPCTEIFYDYGEESASGSAAAGEWSEADRYVEIWNLVFMQYERSRDGTTTLLPRPSVDTGMGLERLAAVLQGVRSNYGTDLFQDLIAKAAELTACSDPDLPSLKVIADHIRACSFLIADGVRPENEGRGYVLRRIIRRAVSHGHRLGTQGPFFYHLVEPLQTLMGDTWPELLDQQIETVLRKEEERFGETLEAGLRILEDGLKSVRGGKIPGELAFRLYDTYGFPVDLTTDIAREKNLEVDLQGFSALMKQQRQRARARQSFSARDPAQGRDTLAVQGGERFSGYTSTCQPATVRQIFIDGEAAASVSEGTEAVVVLDDTPFYAESGGQIGDTGVLEGKPGAFRVDDTRKQGRTHVHVGELERGRLAVGDPVDARVNLARRQRIMRNHSATHLLHAALKQVLGTHVSQRGSLVADNRLRFDFLHDAPLSDEALCAVEDLVNEKILDNTEVGVENMARETALKRGAVALFGEKYDDEVRVLSVGDFSVELCGGTHVQRTGDIGVFKIISETGIAGGIRRIEALTGDGACAYLQNMTRHINKIQGYLQIRNESPEEIARKVQQLVASSKQLKKEIKQLKDSQQRQRSQNLEEQSQEINGIRVLAAQLDGGDRESLRNALDRLKERLGAAAVIVLAAVRDEKVQLVAGISKKLTGEMKAGQLVNFVAGQVGGKGGGRADMAEAGGNNPAMLNAALASVFGWVRSQTKQKQGYCG